MVKQNDKKQKLVMLVNARLQLKFKYLRSYFFTNHISVCVCFLPQRFKQFHFPDFV